MVWPQNIVLCYLALALSRFVVHFITWLWKRECTNCHPCHVKKTSFEPHTASYIIVLSSNVEAAISLYCNSVHSTFPRQQWMAWLCVRAQQASNPNGDKISLFLSRLHNGSGGGGNIDISPLRLSRHKKTIRKSDCRTYGKLTHHCCEWPEAL